MNKPDIKRLHPYRCETCKRYGENCPLTGKFYLSVGIYGLVTSIIGCCSHSDAVAAAKRIKDVIGELREFIDENQCEGSCSFHEMNSDRCHTYKTCDLCVFDHAVESLRNGFEKK